MQTSTSSDSLSTDWGSKFSLASFSDCEKARMDVRLGVKSAARREALRPAIESGVFELLAEFETVEKEE